MKTILWPTLSILFCFFLTVFCGNYTYYAGFAYKNGTTLIANQTMNSCVCKCLLSSGCSGLTYYNATNGCSLLYDPIITESEVSLNNTAILLLVTAGLNTTA